MKGGVIAHGIQKSLAYYRIVETSNTANKLKVAKGVWNGYRVQGELGYLRSAWFFLNYAFNAVKKRI
jgi:teichuronic acid biosynthesis glycosyltransferase TuaG